MPGGGYHDLRVVASPDIVQVLIHAVSEGKIVLTYRIKRELFLDDRDRAGQGGAEKTRSRIDAPIRRPIGISEFVEIIEGRNP